MCLSCGCEEYTEKHDPAAIDWFDLEAAAEDAGLPPVEAAENILSGAIHMTDHPEEAKKGGVALQLLKASHERRYTLGVAYGANLVDAGVAADGHRDFASPDAVEQAAWAFMRKGAHVGLHHEDGTEGHGTVVESYVYRGPDWPQDNGVVVKSGWWLIGVVWDEPTWAAVKAGLVGGFSPQGTAVRRRARRSVLGELETYA